MTHAWHDIPLGDRVEEEFTAIIEIPKGSKVKYELDKESGMLKVDRVLFSAVHYPANYGFLPRTYCDDGDPLDVLVLCQEPVVPMCIMHARAIGMFRMRDDKGGDDKIVAVHTDDPAYNEYTHINRAPAPRPARAAALLPRLQDARRKDRRGGGFRRSGGRESHDSRSNRGVQKASILLI